LNNYQGREAHNAIKEYAHKLGIEAIDLLPVFEGGGKVVVFGLIIVIHTRMKKHIALLLII